MKVYSGQIITTSAEVNLNGGLVGESPPNSPKHSGLGIIGSFAQNIWLFPKIGVPPKWMVYNGKPHEQMDDLGGKNSIYRY